MRRWLRALDHGFDGAFGPAADPLKQLGAIGFLLLWLLAASGIVLYALLETSAAGAYDSISALSRTPAGAALRGLHRYAADAFVLVALLHLAREWVLGCYERFRRHAWITGVVLLPILYGCAIGGFWLHWDRLGQFSALATAEWLDALGFLGSPLARNFLYGAVSDRLFSLFVFVHLGLPLLLVFACWAHVQRIGTPRVFPARPLALGTTLTLLALALLLPVQSQGTAELANAPQRLAFDWLLLFVHPLAAATSASFVWALLALVLAGLLCLPFASRRPRAPVAQVEPAHCNGCGRCVADCPYAAITLVAHPLRRRQPLAQVRSAACAGCGICTGACPSSTPFRSGEAFVTGIDLPHWPLAALRERLQQALAAGARRVLVGCEHGARVEALAGPQVAVLTLPCSGMLPPSFVDYALQHGAASVVVSGCREGGCEYRLGPRWTEARLRGEREPRLRPSVPAGRWHTVWADPGEEARVRAALEAIA
ncbi:MAG TPA: hydrogenase iron-sulfur subunit [Ramlibacter sp.]|uniref:hydrogenase iron-sulfur subunit n=1 Tax=Ramlibacter sp. TaxID=1917967 RepID=UPI002D805244|nr:hydrogenase iron-sulfur subunit [Ramlibacter sp.]HET8747959.1 hydrogenase iron-sulfur subunit [Ramlibacter sp.]